MGRQSTRDSLPPDRPFRNLNTVLAALPESVERMDTYITEHHTINPNIPKRVGGCHTWICKNHHENYNNKELATSGLVHGHQQRLLLLHTDWLTHFYNPMGKTTLHHDRTEVQDREENKNKRETEDL